MRKDASSSVRRRASGRKTIRQKTRRTRRRTSKKTPALSIRRSVSRFSPQACAVARTRMKGNSATTISNSKSVKRRPGFKTRSAGTSSLSPTEPDPRVTHAKAPRSFANPLPASSRELSIVPTALEKSSPRAFYARSTTAKRTEYSRRASSPLKTSNNFGSINSGTPSSTTRKRRSRTKSTRRIVKLKEETHTQGPKKPKFPRAILAPRRFASL